MELFTGQLFLFLQLLFALALGMLLGTERTVAHKTAGLRTYGLVAMGACLFIVIAREVAPTLYADTNLDLMRVVAGIITGIGFLGAGVIIFKESTLVGLTTAAGLWVAAGIGLAVGFELYALALFATVLTLIAFTVFWYVERGVEKFTNGE